MKTARSPTSRTKDREAYSTGFGERRLHDGNGGGEIVWEWDVFNYYNIDDFDYLAGHWETACNSSSAYDWTHFNALTYNESEDALYVSSRHLDRITKIDYTSKNIIWNMGIQWLGDEVIVPNYTMIATINAVTLLKLKPVIIDVDNSLKINDYISSVSVTMSSDV